MKNLWRWATKILFVLLLVSGWYIYEQDDRYKQLEKEYSALSKELEKTQILLAEQKTHSEALEKKTIDSILKETNKAVISGWETLLDTVEKELNKARSSISPAPLEDKPPASTPAPKKQEQVIEGERT